MRSGLYSLVWRLRGMIDDAGTAQTWTDDELQDVLDMHKTRIWRELLQDEATRLSSSSAEHRVFHSRYGNYEEGGTAYFQIEDAAGSQRGTATYTANYVNGVVTMTADQAGTALYLTGWTYDLAGAAAELWRQRAGKVSSYYDFRADEHQLSRSQWFKHCAEMADMYARQAQATTVRSWHVGQRRDE